MKQLDPKNRLLALCGILPKDAHQRFAADNWQQFCGFVNPLLAKIKRNTNGLKLPDVEGLETLMACSPPNPAHAHPVRRIERHEKAGRK